MDRQRLCNVLEGISKKGKCKVLRRLEGILTCFVSLAGSTRFVDASGFNLIDVNVISRSFLRSQVSSPKQHFENLKYLSLF